MMHMSKDLIQAAKSAREHAYAPYSNFAVGAAIRAVSGAIYTGVNVENVAYPEGTCAEAGAIAAMCAAGDRKIVEVAVIAGSAAPVPPCGGCRQKLAEFAGPGVQITMATMGGDTETVTVKDLLPGAFDTAHLNSGQ